MQSVITSKYQITIPKAIRKRIRSFRQGCLGLEGGARENHHFAGQTEFSEISERN